MTEDVNKMQIKTKSVTECLGSDLLRQTDIHLIFSGQWQWILFDCVRVLFGDLLNIYTTFAFFAKENFNFSQKN